MCPSERRCDLCNGSLTLVSFDLAVEGREVAHICLICAIKLERDLAVAIEEPK